LLSARSLPPAAPGRSVSHPARRVPPPTRPGHGSRVIAASAALGDEEILDANNQCAHANYVNRIANGLGLKSTGVRPLPGLRGRAARAGPPSGVRRYHPRMSASPASASVSGTSASSGGHGVPSVPLDALTPLVYRDAELLDIFHDVHAIAMVGASPDWNRPSYFVLKYLLRKGYHVIPVNPRAAGQEILGQRVYASLSEIPEPIDVVDVFRRADAVPGIVAEAIALHAKVVWLQLTVRNDEAARVAEAAGLTVIQDRCMKIEYGRLSGELAWSGVNSGIISSRRRKRLG
jgi:predicted CoA-binding protein